MGDLDSEATFNPKITGDLLLVVEISQTFARLTTARNSMNPKKMILILEAASLLLTGFYGKKSQEAVKNRIDKLHSRVDRLMGEFEQNGIKKGASDIWKELYSIEQDLRLIWHDSGLQLGRGIEDGDNTEFS